MQHHTNLYGNNLIAALSTRQNETFCLCEKQREKATFVNGQQLRMVNH